MFGSTDVGSVGISTGAGHVTQLAAELVLGVPGQNTSAAPAGAAAAALGHLQRRFLLLVLLAFQMLLVSLNRETLKMQREMC